MSRWNKRIIWTKREQDVHVTQFQSTQQFYTDFCSINFFKVLIVLLYIFFSYTSTYSLYMHTYVSFLQMFSLKLPGLLLITNKMFGSKPLHDPGALSLLLGNTLWCIRLVN